MGALDFEGFNKQTHIDNWGGEWNWKTHGPGFCKRRQSLNIMGYT